MGISSLLPPYLTVGIIPAGNPPPFDARTPPAPRGGGGCKYIKNLPPPPFWPFPPPLFFKTVKKPPRGPGARNRDLHVFENLSSSPGRKGRKWGTFASSVELLLFVKK